MHVRVKAAIAGHGLEAFGCPHQTVKLWLPTEAFRAQEVCCLSPCSTTDYK